MKLPKRVRTPRGGASIASSAWYHRHREQEIKKRTAKRRIIRARVLAHYGGNCACCGEANWQFLSIDHKHGDGAHHRKKELGRSTFGGHTFYLWLEKHHYPEGFRVLCFNCNMSLGIWGHCPHSDLRVEPRPDAPTPSNDPQNRLFE